MGRRLYGTVIGLELSVLVLVVAWDVRRLDWLAGYDAFANWRYADAVTTDWRPPSVDETSVWHSPPLWFLLAGLTGRVTTAAGAYEQLGGRVVAAGSGIALAVLVLLLARELWPGRRLLHVVALGVAVFSPVLVRASAMYHPETLAAALAAAGTVCAARLLRGRGGLWTAVLGGLAFGLASLTRTWALPLAAAAVLLLAVGRGPGLRRYALVVTVALLLVAGPWLVNQQRAHGSALAFNRPEPETPLLSRRPPSFYVGPRFVESLSHPYTPRARNQLVPQVYADWWGDYDLVWRPGPASASNVVQLRPGDRRPRVIQSAIGMVPTLLGVAGLVGIALVSIRRRDTGDGPALALVPVGALSLVAAYLLFQLRYPSTDGDTLKATYLLCGLPAFALSVGFAAVVIVERAPRAVALLAAAIGVVTIACSLRFLVL